MGANYANSPGSKLASVGAHARTRQFLRVAAGAAAVTLIEHRLLILLATSYVALGGLLLVGLGRAWPIRLVTGTSLVGGVALSVLWLTWEYVKGPKQLRAALRAPRVLGATVILLVIVPTQITFQALKQTIGATLGFPADPLLHRLDVLLHGQVAWRVYEVFLSNWVVVRSLDVLYVVWHPVLIAFLLWAGWSQARALRRRALLASLLLCIGAGTIMAALAASAGPCYYAYVVNGPSPYAALVERLDSLSLGRGSLFAVIIRIGSVVLGWHYAVDGYAGACCAVAAWLGASALIRHEDRTVSLPS